MTVAHLQVTVEPLPFAKAIIFDVHNEEQQSGEISRADLVISLLPAAFHIQVARECVKLKKHLITASYVSPAFQELHEEAKEKELTLLMECRLDPGIDHMSAMAAIQQVKEKGGKLLAFKSYTGGLVAPEYDNNPWHYKFTWNPRNVVLAGQGTAKYIKDGLYKYIPYHQLFSQAEDLYVDGYGSFEGYANQYSLNYRELYGLQDIPTMLRGTLRRKGYCKAWNVFVQLGFTDDSYTLSGSETMTYKRNVESFLPPTAEMHQTTEQRLSTYLGVMEGGEVMQKLKWLDLLTDTPVLLTDATPAQVLEKILKEKWLLEPGDKDMVVMQHFIEYELNGEKHEQSSTLVITGEDEVHTAMAKTVGLPVGVLTKLLLQGKVKRHGVVIPVYPDLYKPVAGRAKAV
ncbi:saccharopine dehydrogenase C-terminal domain-containing protein [Pontibacter silvestris]|uniref:Saccharopine dehydrogenase C-terminal domain-containing protein n=1 Tax=Pontibacter silvestris TaxID=2305183 RepID=A0ABW4WS51_9BACT|nr:saccharopine dehydrogenase C-terminal domain-containing protein [Pontibacter silvestris]MCC9136224.1 saccharopine dehydrogenase NADP-binding domain-containing protein [Pontibacter silvestris]